MRIGKNRLKKKKKKLPKKERGREGQWGGNMKVRVREKKKKS